MLPSKLTRMVIFRLSVLSRGTFELKINAGICLATHLSYTYALLSIPVSDVIPENY